MPSNDCSPVLFNLVNYPHFSVNSNDIKEKLSYMKIQSVMNFVKTVYLRVECLVRFRYCRSKTHQKVQTKCRLWICAKECDPGKNNQYAYKFKGCLK